MSPRGRSRFSRIEGRGPEGRLSEMLCLLLQVDPDLVRQLVGFLTGWEPLEGEVQIHTEVPTRLGKFVDLEIRQELPNRRIVWIEIKRDLKGESSEGQVAGYLRELSELCGDSGMGCVVYLPRPGVLDPNPAPHGQVTYRYTDWTEIGSWMEAQGEQRGPLIRDFVQYLKEEQLYVTGLDTAGLEQLENRVPDRFAKLIVQAKDRIESGVGAMGVDASQATFRPSDAGKWVLGWGRQDTWAHFPLPEGTPGYGQMKLEWNLRERLSGEHLGAVVFGAGLTWTAEAGDPWFGEAELLDAALESQNGMRFDAYEDDRLRFFRWLGPGEIVSASADFNGQVAELTNFVIKAFGDGVAGLKQLEGHFPTDQSDD